MGVRARISDRGVDEFTSAASEWLSAAVCLRGGGRYAGARYLLGYVAETQLKAALRRLLGLRVEAPWRSLRGQTKSLSERHLGEPEAEGGHGLPNWMLVLMVSLRSRTDRDTRELAKLLAGRGRRIHDHWTVDLRYRAICLDEGPVQQVHADVVKLTDSLSQLRS